MNKIGMLLAVIFFTHFFPTAVFALTDNSVLSQHITEADGTTGQNTDTGSGIKTGHIQDGAVTTNKIAAGAVTDVQVTGPISRSKIEKYAKVTIVAQSGGDYADPLSAMNAITSWCGTPSATNPCLIKIMPGIYDIGENTLYMQPYVTIAGSGQNITKITAQPQIYSVVISPYLADNAEIRSLTIENRNPVPLTGTRLTGIWIEGNFTLDDVKIIVSGNTDGETYNNAIMVAGNAPHTVVIKNSTIVNSFGQGIIIESGPTVKISNSDIIAGYRALYVSFGTAYVVNTQLDSGQGNWFTSSSKCVGVYDGNYNPIVCP